MDATQSKAKKAEAMRKYRAAHPERISASRRANAEKRSSESRAKLSSPFPRNQIISKELLLAARAAGDRYTFQHPQNTLAWAKQLPEELLNEILSAGISRLIPQAREITRAGREDPNYIAQMRALTNAKSAIAYTEVKAFRKLLATGDRELIENSWRDDFWGWGPNRDGQNMLGKLWMEVRAELGGSAGGEPASPHGNSGRPS